MEPKKSMRPNCSLSDDLILQEIIPKLPTKSAIRFKSVSKTWLSLISQHSSLIAAKHTARENPGSIICERYSTDNCTTANRLFFLGHNDSNLVEINTSYIYKKNPDSFVLIGSCNGLVCLKLLYSDETHDLVLWNPATREVSYLPTEEWFTKYAIGCDAHRGIKVVGMKKEGPSVKAQIFCNKSGRWRNLKSSTPIATSLIMVALEGHGLNVDGVIYWRREPFNLTSLDVSEEEFGEFDGPLSYPEYTFVDCFCYKLIKWKGHLGVVYLKMGGAEIQVWLKNKDSNNSDSGWTKTSTIQPSLGPISLRRVFNAQITLLCYTDGREVLYDLLTKENRELEEDCVQTLRCSTNILDHFYTLISPN